MREITGCVLIFLSIRGILGHVTAYPVYTASEQTVHGATFFYGVLADGGPAHAVQFPCLRHHEAVAGFIYSECSDFALISRCMD